VSSIATDPTPHLRPLPHVGSALLALLAAAAVGYAAGDRLLPVLGWALLAVAALRGVGLAVHTSLVAAGHGRRADRTALLVEGALAIAASTAGWATGVVPSVGDGALTAMVVASLAALAPRVLD
jgi:hypothetical protein